MPELKQLYIWHALIFLVSVNFIPAQEKPVEQLIGQSTYYYDKYELDSAWNYAVKAENLAKQKKDPKGILSSKIIQANIQIEQDQLENAKLNAVEILKISTQINDKFSEAVANMQLGQIYLYSNQFEKATPYFELSINTYFSKHPSAEAALAYNDYGYILGKLGKVELQLENLLNSLRINENLQPIDDYEIAAVLNNLSTVYLELRQPEKAIAYAKRSIAYREKTGDADHLALGYCNISQMYRSVDLTEAEKYRKLCVEFAEKSGNESRIVQSYVTSALIFGDQNNSEKGMEFEKKAISVLEKNNQSPTLLASRYLSLAIHGIKFNLDSAEIKSYLEKSKTLALQLHDKPLLREIYFNYYTYYKNHHDFENALNSYRTFNQYRDSIINENTKSNIAELETKYETEKKDNQINQLSTDQKIKQLQIEKQNALIAGNELEAERKEKEIQFLSQEKELQELRIGKQNELIEKQRLLSLSNQQKLQIAEQEKIIQNRKLRNSKIVQYLIFGVSGLTLLLGYILFNRYQLKRTIKEQKKLLGIRENIAKDLHDEIGSTLTSIKILSEVSEKKLKKEKPEISEFLTQITEQSSQAQQSISDIVWSVNPENDSLENMVIRMREYLIQTLENKNIQTHFNIDEALLQTNLKMEKRRDFLLLFKEAINNIAKHSHANQVWINLLKKNDNILLKIVDDGIGFEKDLIHSRNGLKNMKSRAESMQGELNLESKNGKGTQLELYLKTT